MSISTEATTFVPQMVKTLTELTFSWYDYTLFSVMLLLSTFIGIYFGCFGSKQNTANEYLMGGKKMKVFPISVSLVASHISGITLLALPADIYRHGATYWLFTVTLAIVWFLTVQIFLPVFYKLQIRSTYEYLERRFDSKTRMFASFLFALGLFFYLPVVIYIPALAFSAATGINVHYITPMVCGVCIFYTTLGGLKAVVWTDTLQFIVTVGAVVTVVVVGVKSGGGFSVIWTKALEGDRLNVFDFDPDPTKRDSFWTVVIGLSVGWLAQCGIHQSSVQKFMSVSTYREAKLTVACYNIGFAIVGSFSVFTGLIMYAKYADCDPVLSGAMKKNDQLLPYYILDVASKIPGLPGLFIAGVFCAALSTLSASLNCLAGTMYEDFISKFIAQGKDEKHAATVLKVLVVVLGIICTALVFVVEKLGGIIPLVFTLAGMTNGPLLGLFIVGVLLPKVSSKGALYGSILGMLFASWLVLMVQYYKAKGIIVDIPKPLSIAGCPANIATSSFGMPIILHNETTTEPSTISLNLTTSPYNLSSILQNDTTPRSSEKSTSEERFTPFVLFRISFWYYTPLAVLATVIFALLISYLLNNDDPPVHRDLLSPVIYFLLPEEKPQEDKFKQYYSLNKALHLVTTNWEKEDDSQIRS